MNVQRIAAPQQAVPPASALAEEDILIETRFGTVTASPSAVVDMPVGPLGFAQHRQFVLIDLPNPRLAEFKLLQSLTAPEVSFVVTPLGGDGALIAAEDVEGACVAAGMAPQDAVVLLILTVRQAGEGAAMSVNLRAPVMLDTRHRIARQIVLGNPNYSVRHPI